MDDGVDALDGGADRLVAHQIVEERHERRVDRLGRGLVGVGRDENPNQDLI